MTSLTTQLLWIKYWDLHDENSFMKLYIQEKDETIAQLRRELIRARSKITRIEQAGELGSLEAAR